MADKPATVSLPIALLPTQLTCIYADLAAVQITENDLRISFYQTMPPTAQQGQTPETIPAECVGRLVVTEQVAKFIVAVLQRALDNFGAARRPAPAPKKS